MCLDPVDVVRMNLRSTVSLTPLVESDAVIRERDSVRIQALGLGSQDADKLGRETQDLPKLHFLLFKFLFGLLALIYVRKQGIPPNNRAVLITLRSPTYVKPTVDTVE